MPSLNTIFSAAKAAQGLQMSVSGWVSVSNLTLRGYTPSWGIGDLLTLVNSLV